MGIVQQIFKVSSQCRVQQLVGSTVEVFKVYALDRVQQASSVSGSPTAALNDADEPFEGGFRTFPQSQKSARVAGQSSAELGAHSS